MKADWLDYFNRTYLLGASLGSMMGCLLGVAGLPLFGLPWWVCVVGVFLMAWVAQGTWNQYHKRKAKD